jgi:hypothetical protein
MLAGDGASRMAAQVGKFHDSACEASTRPFRLRCPIRKLTKEGIDQILSPLWAGETSHPVNCHFAGTRKRGRDEIILARKMLVERTLCNAGARRDVVH